MTTKLAQLRVSRLTVVLKFITHDKLAAIESVRSITKRKPRRKNDTIGELYFILIQQTGGICAPSCRPHLVGGHQYAKPASQFINKDVVR